MKKTTFLIFLLALISASQAHGQETQTPEIKFQDWQYAPLEKISRITLALDNPDQENICSLDLIFRLIDFEYISHESHTSIECRWIGSNFWECYQGFDLQIAGELVSFQLQGSGRIEFEFAMKNSECDPWDPEIIAHDWKLQEQLIPWVIK